MQIEEKPEREYRNPKKLKLHPSQRDIRRNGVDKLKKSVRKNGYNPNKPLGLIKENSEEYVIVGGHRLKALQAIELGEIDITEVPVLIYKETNPIKLAKRDNADEDTYSPEDLFDDLDAIQYLKEQGLTQKEIGGRLGWSREKVKDYQTVNNKIGATILSLAKEHQKGRAPKNGANAPFDFTEGWFRTSGIYDLEDEYQEQLMEDFISSNFKWSKDKIKKESKKYKRWQEYLDLAEEELHNDDYLDNIKELIENNTFRKKKSLYKKIDDFNQKSKNKLIQGNAKKILKEEIDDSEIDIVITDPPYGIDYTSNRSKYDDHVTKEGVTNDEQLEKAMNLTKETLKILIDKTKSEAHFYIFTSWKTYPELIKRIPEELSIKNLIIWDKVNHGAGDLEGAWGNRYEMILFASKGNKNLKTRKQDIVQASKVSSDKMITPTQKPVKVIKELLKASANNKDTVCDPFMGSGSTIKAVREYGNLNYIGMEVDSDIFQKAKSFIEE